MTVAALFTAAAMCVGGCGDAAAATSGADSLYQGLSQVNAALAQAAQADPSLAGLAASVSQLTDGSKQLADGVSTYTKGVEKACDSIDDSSASNTDDTEKKQELQSLTEKLKWYTIPIFSKMKWSRQWNWSRHANALKNCALS